MLQDQTNASNKPRLLSHQQASPGTSLMASCSVAPSEYDVAIYRLTKGADQSDPVDDHWRKKLQLGSGEIVDRKPQSGSAWMAALGLARMVLYRFSHSLILRIELNEQLTPDPMLIANPKKTPPLSTEVD